MRGKRSGDVDLTRYFGLVRSIAYSLRRHLPPSVDVEDLIQSGMIGLVEASRRWKEAGTKFTTFAGFRIRGAMMDSLRVSDHLPRPARNLLTRAERAKVALRHELGREPTEGEIIKRLRANPEMYRAALVHATGPVSIEDLGEGDMIEALPDPSPGPLEQLLRHADRERVRDAIAKLPMRDQIVLHLRFEEDMAQVDIARRLGVTESRISQNILAATERLRSRLQ